jgi:NAD(P)-dependent dehydrogenase (short-subunit alcohol dehydrogenase family)
MNTIVMTGATSGIGKVAAEQIRETPRVQLVIGARVAPPDGREVLPLDLGHLESVRAFVQQAEAWLGDRPINGLVLNAATQFGNIDQRTEDGFETTFAVNHLAHYLLLRLLTPRLAQNAIVVITTSNSHDPLTNPVAPPTHADALRLARPRAEPGRRMRPVLEGMRAYAASKLCNLLTARALAASPIGQARALRVIAFNPGLTPGTGLARNNSRALRVLAAVLVPSLSPVLRINTLAGGGALLADLSLGRIVPPPGRLYASQVKRRLTWPDPSELAQRDDVMAKLWRDSAMMVGLPEQP